MTLFPPGDNAPFDIYPLKSPLSGVELVEIQNEGTTKLYARVAEIGQIDGVINILAMGGSGDGVTDNLAAYAAAVAALSSRGGTIYFPPGIYYFSAEAAMTCAASAYGISVIGAGRQSTILKFSHASNGLVFNLTSTLNAVCVRHLTMLTNDTAYTAILINQTIVAFPGTGFTYNVIEDIEFYGVDGYPSVDNYWHIAVDLVKVYQTNIMGCHFYGGLPPAGESGTGVRIAGTAAFAACALNITASFFVYLNTAVYVGLNAQGVTMTSCNIQGCDHGFVVPAGATGIDQILIIGNYLNCYVQGLIFNEVVSDLIIMGNYFDATQAAATPIYLLKYENVVVNGNTFWSKVSPIATAGTVAINLDVSTSTGGLNFVANTVLGFTAGVQTSANSTHLTIQSNRFDGCTTSISNNATGNVVRNNVGVNPVGASAQSPGSSPWTYTAGASPETLYVAASTSITAVTQGGVSILPAATGADINHTISLGPNEPVVITYTGSLTAKTMIH